MAKSVIALYGAPGAGLNTLTSMLATTFAKKGENVAIILDDILYSSLPLFTSSYDSSKSLGKVLNLSINDTSKISNDVLIKSMQSTKLPEVGIYSYMIGETASTYEKYTSAVAARFLDRVSGLSDIDYVIIKCRRSINESPLTEEALAKADVVLQVSNPSIKSRQYRKNQRGYLLKRNGNFTDFLVLMNVYKGDPVEDFIAAEKVDKDTVFQFEHNEDLFCQVRDGSLLNELSGFINKSNQRINSELSKLCTFIENYEPVIDEWEEEYDEYDEELEIEDEEFDELDPEFVSEEGEEKPNYESEIIDTE